MKTDDPKKPITNQEDTAFENPSTDPGFEPSFLEEESPLEEEKDEDIKKYEPGDDPSSEII
ncbi:hypothetical protein [Pedobacter sp.]|uniref:hypothetical protein n=1 Tax=Pedobacter sp. TaxID=1411316 RepID=UPI003D7FD8DB